LRRGDIIRPIAGGAALAAALLLHAPSATAQQPPTPLFQPMAPPSTAPSAEPLPPAAPAAPTEPETAPPPALAPPAAAPVAPPAAPTMQSTRVFCDQQVTVRVADPDSVPEQFRGFLGIWSDASWDPRTCAALIVENVQQDGTAVITYVYGPNGSSSKVPGGVLHGTGVIRGGQLLFQNSDGTQFVFRPLLADLDGRMTTPKGTTFEAVFKQTP